MWEAIGENGWLHCLAMTDKSQMSSERCLCQTSHLFPLVQHILVYIGRYDLECFVCCNKRWTYFDPLRQEGFSTHLWPCVLERAQATASPLIPYDFELGLFIAIAQEHPFWRATRFESNWKICLNKRSHTILWENLCLNKEIGNNQSAFLCHFFLP